MRKKIIIGLITGIFCGLFSSGGGLILIPALTRFLNLSEKEARANSIFCILPMVIVSSLIYKVSTNCEIKGLFFIILGEILGSIIGSKLLNKMSAKYLEIIFIIFLFYSGIKNLL